MILVNHVVIHTLTSRPRILLADSSRFTRHRSTQAATRRWRRQRNLLNDHLATFLRVSLNRRGAARRHLWIKVMHGTQIYMYNTRSYARMWARSLSAVRTTARGTISVYNVYTATAHVSALYSALYSAMCCAISHACMYVHTMSPDCVSRKFMRALYSYVYICNGTLHRLILPPRLKNFPVW